MTAEYDRQIVIDNIMTLIQRHNTKVGEFEKQMGVSTGYISRLSKKDSASAISAEFIWKVAQYFNVSVDCIIRSRINEEDRKIDYMRKFINKIIKRTNDGTLEWKAIRVEEINHMLMEETRSAFPVVYVRRAGFQKNSPHKSTDSVRIDNALGCWGDNKVISCIYGGAIVNPQGTIYHTSMPYGDQSDKELYLAYYCTDTEGGPEEFYELMILDTRGLNDFIDSQDDDEYRQVIGKKEIPSFVEGICNTYQSAWYPIKAEMQELYQDVSTHENDIILSDSVKSFIDAYSRFDKGLDECPF